MLKRTGAIGWGLGLALMAAVPAVAQMPPAAPLLHSAWIEDCNPARPNVDFCRLSPAFEADEAERRLAAAGPDADVVMWIDGKVLNVAARKTGARAMLTGSFEESLVPLSTRRPLWGAAYRIAGIDRAMIEIGLQGSKSQTLVYRGPNAPPVPPMNAPLKGRIETLDIQSAALGSSRRVEVYVPPGKAPEGGWPTVIATTGLPLAPFAAIADALIERREMRPVAIVALAPGLEAEYLRGKDADGFTRHNLFVRREALPQVETRFHLSPRTADRVLFGIGAGADWALDAEAYDPNLAFAVAAFSPLGHEEFPFRNKALRLFIQGGQFEGPYLKGARTTCNLAGASESPCTLDITVSGHAPLVWQAEWAKALKQLLPARRR